MLHIVCESTAAIVAHVRRIGDVAPNYGGHVVRPLALCGAPIAWDTKLPLAATTCRTCRDRFAAEKDRTP